MIRPPPATAGGIDAGKPLERHPEQRDVQGADGGIGVAGGELPKGLAARLQQPGAIPGSEAEPTLATGQPARGLEPCHEVADRQLGDVEQLGQAAHERGGSPRSQAADNAMRGQDRERGRGIEEQHEQEVERGVLLRGALAPLVPIAGRRLVPVVAIGDEHGTGRGRGDQGSGGRTLALVGHHPQPVSHVVVVRHVGHRGSHHRGGKRRRGAPGGALVEPDHRRRVDSGRPQQAIPVLLGGGEGSLMRQHRGPGSKRLDPEPGEEPALDALDVRPGNAIGLLVHVHGGPRVLAQRSVRAPGGEGPGGSPVALIGVLAWLAIGQVETDAVAGMAGEQIAMELSADHVIGRGDDQAQVAHRLGVVAEGAEGSDVGHEVLWAR